MPKSDTYKQFECAYNHLANKRGIPIGRMFDLADKYGYFRFAKFCPETQSEPQQEGPAETAPSYEAEDTGEETEGAPEVETSAYMALSSYESAAGIAEGMHGTALTHHLSWVDTGQGDRGQMKKWRKQSVNNSWDNLRHWIALMGILRFGQNSWDRNQEARIRGLRQRMTDEFSTWIGASTDTQEGKNREEIESAITAVTKKAERTSDYEYLGKWLWENIYVQQWQRFMPLTDWIEVTGVA